MMAELAGYYNVLLRVPLSRRHFFYLDGVATGPGKYFCNVANDRITDDNSELAASRFIVWLTCTSCYHNVGINLNLVC